jgi:hypothetical protein
MNLVLFTQLGSVFYNAGVERYRNDETFICVFNLVSRECNTLRSELREAVG